MLRGLVPEARYRLVDFDVGKAWEATGREVGQQGIAVESAERPAAVILHYSRKSVRNRD